MDIQLPDGTILRGVPEGTTRAQITAKLGADSPRLKPPKLSAGDVAGGLAVDAAQGLGTAATSSTLGAVDTVQRLNRRVLLNPEDFDVGSVVDAGKRAYNWAEGKVDRALGGTGEPILDTSTPTDLKVPNPIGRALAGTPERRAVTEMALTATPQGRAIFGTPVKDTAPYQDYVQPALDAVSNKVEAMKPTRFHLAEQSFARDLKAVEQIDDPIEQVKALGSVIKNHPASSLGMLAQSAPSMVASIATGRSVTSIGSKLVAQQALEQGLSPQLARSLAQTWAQTKGAKLSAMAVAGNATAQSVGSTVDQVRDAIQNTPDAVLQKQSTKYREARTYLSEQEAKRAMMASASDATASTTALTSGLSSLLTAGFESKLGQKLTAAEKPEFAKRIFEGITKEGAQETFESGGEQYGQNAGLIASGAAPNLDPWSGVVQQGLLGGITGSVMGGTAGAARGAALSFANREQKDDAPPNKAPNPKDATVEVVFPNGVKASSTGPTAGQDDEIASAFQNLGNDEAGDAETGGDLPSADGIEVGELKNDPVEIQLQGEADDQTPVKPASGISGGRPDEPGGGTGGGLGGSGGGGQAIESTGQEPASGSGPVQSVRDDTGQPPVPLSDSFSTGPENKTEAPNGEDDAARLARQRNEARAAGNEAEAKRLDKELTKAFGAQVESNKQVRQYRELAQREAGNPDYFNADLAKHLDEQYANDRGSRLTRSDELQEQAAAIRDKAFWKRIAEPAKPDETVVFMAGGTGSGKSSAKPTSGIVYDTTLANADSAIEKIQRVLDSGRDVELRYVFTEPNVALKRAISRAKGEEGRPVPIETHANTHIGANETARRVAEHFSGDDRVRIRAYDNSGIHKKQVDAIPAFDYNGVRDQLHATLEAERAAGAIDASQFRAFGGSAGRLGRNEAHQEVPVRERTEAGRGTDVPRHDQAEGLVAPAAAPEPQTPVSPSAQHEAPVSGLPLHAESPVSSKAPAPVQGKKARQKKEAAPETSAEVGERGRRLLLGTIRNAGGIDIRERSDITGERGRSAARMAPGMFHKNGRGIDDIATILHEAGYLTDADVADVDGGVQRARDLIADALGKQPVVPDHMADDYARLRHEESLSSRQEAEDANRDDEAASDLTDVGLKADSDRDVIDHDLINRFRDHNEDEFDEARAKFGDDLEGLQEWIHDRINSESQSAAGELRERRTLQKTAGSFGFDEGAEEGGSSGGSRGGGPDRARQEGAGDAGRAHREEQTDVGRQAQGAATAGQPEQPSGADREVGRPALELESQTEEGLAEQAAQQRATEAAEREENRRSAEKAQADRDRNDFTLTGSNRPADVAMARGQGDLLGSSKPARPVSSQSASTTAAPAHAPVTTDDVDAFHRDSSALISDAIDAMSANEVQKRAAKYADQFGLKRPVGKKQAKALLTDAQSGNRLAAMDAAGVTPTPKQARIHEAMLAGKVAASQKSVVDGLTDDEVGKVYSRLNLAGGKQTAAQKRATLKGEDAGEVDAAIARVRNPRFALADDGHTTIADEFTRVMSRAKNNTAFTQGTELSDQADDVAELESLLSEAGGDDKARIRVLRGSGLQTQSTKTTAPGASQSNAGSVSRSRPRETIEFKRPIVGPSGAKLVSYTWQWKPIDFIDATGEERVKRVSDWKNSEESAETGREVVHQFVVESADGKRSIVSAESALGLLGFGGGTQSSGVKSVSSAAKTLARLRMQLAESRQYQEAFRAEGRKLNTLTRPEVKRGEESNGSVWWTMGDARVRQIGGNLNEIAPERLRALIDAWVSNRLAERGFNQSAESIDDKVRDLESRTDRAEKKLDRLVSASADAVGSSPAESREPAPVHTHADVTAAEQHVAEQVSARIDAMTANEVQKIGARFLPTMGVKVPVGKAKIKAAVTNFAAVNPLAAAGEFGVDVPAHMRGALEAKLSGTVQAGLSTEAQESAEGPFGPILTQFHHDAQGAIAKLKELQTGEAVAALHHPEVGDIDLVWGERGTPDKDFEDGFGIAKIAEKHPEVLADLQGFVAGLRKNEAKSGPNRIRLESPDGGAVVRLDWDGKTKKWLMTAYVPEGGSAATGGRTGVPGRAESAPPAEQGAEPDDQTTRAAEGSPAPADERGVLEQIDDVIVALSEGTATVAQYRDAFQRAVDSPEAIKAALGKKTKDQLDRLAPSFRRDRKKAEMVDDAYEAMQRRFALGKEYGPSGYMMGQHQQYALDKAKALRELVAGQTADDLAAYAAEVKQAREEAAGQRAARQEAIENPKTLDDFHALMRAKVDGGMSLRDARLTLTAEQRAEYDRLAAEKSRASRKDRKDDDRAPKAAGQTVGGQIVETKHTQKGHDLFVVQLAERVSREDYTTLNTSAKKLGGYYSSFRGRGAVPGFQFRDRASADAFLKLAAGDATQAQEAAQARRDAFDDDRSQSATERLTEMADRLEERADESLTAERKTNTHRRSDIAARAESAARADKALAQTMRNIARALGDGVANMLDRVRTKSQVALLNETLRTAKSDELREKYTSYADQEKNRGEAPTADTVEYANWPKFTMYRSDLAVLARQLLEVDGLKQLGAKLLKVADDVTDAYTKFAKENYHKVSPYRINDGSVATIPTRDAAEAAIRRAGLVGKAIVLPLGRGKNAIVMSPSEAMARGIWKGDGDQRITIAPDIGSEIVTKLKGNKKNPAPWQFVTAHERRAAWARMGIETPAEFRTALREFIGLREQAQEADRIKEMERSMIGRVNDGLDFFPTPTSVADEMIDAAEITPEMAVLEPSAGMGHIADRIRAAGAEPDVIEMSGRRRELLEAKGFNLVGSDFMDVKAREGFTFGDVFEHADGRRGVMRGSGGMGSGRVGFIPEGKTEREREWVNRDDLTGVEHRGDGYDRIVMNPPFSDGRDMKHVRHAYSLLRPGGRIVAIMGEGAFFRDNKEARDFREWLESVGGTSEKLAEGSFLDPSLPVNTGVAARMVVIEKSGVDFDLSPEPPGGGMSVARAEQMAGIIAGKWTNAPRIVVLASMDDPKTPQAARDAVRQQRAAGATGSPRAFIMGDTAYLVAGAIPDAKQLIRSLSHEVLGHYGLRGAFGGELSTVLDQIATLRKADVEAKARQYGHDASNQAARRRAAEEVLAEMAEKSPQLGFVRRAVAAIRSFLRSLGFNVAYSDAEIVRDFILPAREWVQRGGAAQGEMSGAFATHRGPEVFDVGFELPNGKRFARVTRDETGERYEYFFTRDEAEGARSAVVGDRANEAFSAAVSDDSRQADLRPQGDEEQRLVVAVRQRKAGAFRTAMAVRRAVRERGSLHDPAREGRCFELAAGASAAGLGDMLIGRMSKPEGGRDWHGVVRDADGFIYDPTDRNWYASGAYQQAYGFAPVRSLTQQAVRAFLSANNGLSPDPRSLGMVEDVDFQFADQTETPAFKRWFGDSKVVGASGKPLVVYHGTKAPGFDSFSTRGETSTSGDDFKFSPLGAWVTDAPRIANNYATDFNGTGNNGAVISLYVSIRKPFEISYDKLNELVASQRSAKALRVKLEADGYDGMKVGRYGGADGFDYVAFRPEQIKSATDNVGTFDPQKSNIRYSRPAPQARRGDAASADLDASRVQSALPMDYPQITSGDAANQEALSIKNAATDALRLRYGYPEAEKAARRDFGSVWDEARPQTIEDAREVDALIDELKANPRPVTDTENAKLLYHHIEISNEIESLADKISDLHKTGTQSDMAPLLFRKQRLDDQMFALLEVERAIGTANARGLNARRIMALRDYTLANMQAQVRAEVAGRPLTEAENQTIAELSKRIRDLEKKIDEMAAQKMSEQAFTEAMNDAEANAAKVDPTAPGNDRDARRRRNQEIVQQLKLGFEEGAPDHEIGDLIQQLARSLVEGGVRDRNKLVDGVREGLKGMGVEMSRRDVMDAISGYGKFSPLSKDEIDVELRRMRGEMQQVAKIEDILSGKQPLKTGREQREPGDEERALRKQVYDLMKQYGITTADPARQLKSVLDSIKTRLRNQITDYEKAIAKRERIVRNKGLPPTDAEVQRLTERRDQARADYEALFPRQPRQLSDEDRVRLAEMQLQRSIDEYERRITEGELFHNRSDDRAPQSPKLDALRARRAALREELQALRMASPEWQAEKERRALQALKTRLRNDTARLQERIANKDFSEPTPRKPTPLDPEAHALRFERDKAQREFHELLMKHRIANWDWRQRWWHGFKEFAGLPRALMTMLDLSAILRQGAFIAYGHPVKAAKAVPMSVKAFFDLSSYHRSMEEIRHRPNATSGLYQRAGLFLADDGTKLSDREEVYMSRWLEKVPGLRVIYKGSEHAYNAFLNRLRADSFDAMVKTLAISGNLTDEEAKGIAYYVNNATGRGSVFGAKHGGELASQLFFSPRYVTSRFALAAGVPLLKAGSGRARKLIAMEYARFAAGLVVIYGLAAMAGWDTPFDKDDDENTRDARSSNFGKIVDRDGNIHIDPLAGLSQVLTFTGRMLTGEKLTNRGRLQELRGFRVKYGQSDASDVAKQFLRSKLAPVPGLVWTMANGKDYLGKHVDLESTDIDAGDRVVSASELALGNTLPMSITNVVEIANSGGSIPQAALLSGLMIMGVGVNVYDQ